MNYTPHTVWIGGPPVAPQKTVSISPPKAKHQAAFRKHSCAIERNAFILERRAAGEKFKDIAVQAGVSEAWCQQVHSKEVRRARA